MKKPTHKFKLKSSTHKSNNENLISFATTWKTLFEINFTLLLLALNVSWCVTYCCV
jgi:hypothetical protein